MKQPLGLEVPDRFSKWEERWSGHETKAGHLYHRINGELSCPRAKKNTRPHLSNYTGGLLVAYIFLRSTGIGPVTTIARIVPSAISHSQTQKLIIRAYGTPATPGAMEVDSTQSC